MQPFWLSNGKEGIALFDQGVDTRHKRLRNREAYGLCSLEVNRQFILRRLFDRHVSR